MSAEARSDAAGPLERRADGSLHLHVKVVPGASRAALAGPYGDRLKLRVTAPAESGKANKAVLALLAQTLLCPASELELLRGAGMPLKTIVVRGVSVQDARQRLSLESP